jgi:hypothetical protein
MGVDGKELKEQINYYSKRGVGLFQNIPFNGFMI